MASWHLPHVDSDKLVYEAVLKAPASVLIRHAKASHGRAVLTDDTALRGH